MILFILGLLTAASAGPASDNKDTYKDQYCTDPRTMRKHDAYTEWADAYSCTRHRCQPGGRNLAIYTVGCKRVEAPESAIECEEVVEDTNMQFPFCCTRLRCLVVVRGEVWTRVLGQPWEVLPAAPWSHMYKMKKPPPADSTFLPKTNDQGPVYELSEPESDGGGHEKVLRSGKKPVSDPECNDVVPRAAPPPPDIVIALTTNTEMKEPSSHKKFENSRRSHIKPETSRHKRVRKTTPTSPSQFVEEDREREREGDKEREKRIEPEILELEDGPITTDKSRDSHLQVVPASSVLQFLHPVEISQMDRRSAEGSLNRLDAEGGVTPPETSEERIYSNTFGVTQKPVHKNSHHQVSWTEIPQNQWSEHEGMDVENRANEPSYHAPEFLAQEVPEPEQQTVNTGTKDEKPSNLQALVDAIGTRMRDIENVVQKMSDKVHQVKPALAVGEGSNEKRLSGEDGSHKRHKADTKRPSTEAENYKRFSVRSRGSKYLHSTSDITTEQPLFVEDTNLTGYFSDASNSVLRRSNPPKEPPPTYMAPVENRRKAPAHIAIVSDNSDDAEKKRKKHTHKKRKGKNGHTHKKHRKDDKRKHFNRLSSGEIEKNVVSLEDSSALAST